MVEHGPWTRRMKWSRESEGFTDTSESTALSLLSQTWFYLVSES